MEPNCTLRALITTNNLQRRNPINKVESPKKDSFLFPNLAMSLHIVIEFSLYLFPGNFAF